VCFSPFLPVLSRRLFCFDLQNNFLHKTGKNREKHRNQQTRGRQFLVYIIEDYMELPHIYQAVLAFNINKYFDFNPISFTIDIIPNVRMSALHFKDISRGIKAV
jgi:hypothetical protein